MLAFVRFRIRFLNLIVLECKKVQTFDFAGVFGKKFGELVLDAIRFRMKVPDIFGRRSGFGKSVDEGKLASAVEERLLFVLTMDVQKRRRKLAKGGDGARLVVDV